MVSEQRLSCWIHHHYHGPFSGKEYIRKDFYAAHQEKCQNSANSENMANSAKKIQLVKKKKKALKKKTKKKNVLNVLNVLKKKTKKKVALKKVRGSNLPPGDAQQWSESLIIASVESEVPVPPSEASAEVELPKAEASVAVSPAGIKQEPVGWTCKMSGDIRDLFDVTSDEESDDETKDVTYSPILEPVIENLGSHNIDSGGSASQSPLLVSTSPKDGDGST